MLRFILNNQTVQTDMPAGTTVLDFVRYHKNLKGTKIGCREGDCGACTILVGELKDGSVKYLSMTSCLMPIVNASGKHIVTVEGINKSDGELTEAQQAMVENSGTQCGFCTVGFVMSLTGFCVDETLKTCESAISSIDGNICRCTGYKSIERAAESLTGVLSEKNGQSRLDFAIEKGIVPVYFSEMKTRLKSLSAPTNIQEIALQPNVAKHGAEDQYTSEKSKSKIENRKPFVGGGTDLYVQNPEEMVYASAQNLFDNPDLRFIKETDEFVEIGASTVVTDLLVSPIMQNLFPNLYKHLKLVSSTPIRNMATLAGNFVNASPIGDMTAWFMALDASVVFDNDRELPLRRLYLGYKTLAKTEDEFIKKIRFRKPIGDFYFNFEKVSKRTCLDISSVNTAISIKSEPPASAGGLNVILEAHASAGGVAPIPLYLKKTSEFLLGREVSDETILQANEILQAEISPISDVRGSESYKRLLLRQLFTAHFVELFDFEPRSWL